MKIKFTFGSLFTFTVKQSYLLTIFLLFLGSTLSFAQNSIGFVSGNIQFQFSPNVTTATVSAWGAGGPGGSVTTPSGAKVVAGGGGGAFAQLSALSVSGSTIYFGYAGIGGAGVNGVDGGNGNDSWFVNDTTLLAKGGVGGKLGTTTTNGAVGTGGLASASIVNVKFNGGNSSQGTAGSYSGAGGGSAGFGGIGGNASNAVGGTAGLGPPAGAVGAAGRSSGNGAGDNGNIPGSGGAGSKASGGGIPADGNGEDGRILISYTGYCRPLSALSATFIDLFTTAGGTTIINNVSSGIGGYGSRTGTI